MSLLSRLGEAFDKTYLHFYKKDVSAKLRLHWSSGFGEDVFVCGFRPIREFFPHLET